MRCAVFGCNVDNQCKSFTPGIKFFTFPKDKELQAVWKRMCKRKDKFNINNARVCSKHFSDSDYERNLKHELLGYTPKSYRSLRKNAVPSKNVPNMSRQKGTSGRVERQEKRQQKRMVENIVKGSDPAPNLKKSQDNEINSTLEIFSREGDTGTSKTITGDTLSKDSQIFNAIGATEELLSYIGLAREHGNESEHEYTDKLKRIQTIIIDISTAISRSNKVAIPTVYTKELEDWISEYAKQLPPPEQYIIPGGGVASASLHVARSICRKTERVVCPLVRDQKLDKEALVYLNRLSDFLLTVSRIAAKLDQRTESIYIPKPDEKVQPQ